MPSAWHQAAKSGDSEAIARMLSDGQAIDRKDRYGQTALMLAATHGHIAVAETLLDRVAETDVTAKYGLSALMLAIVNHHADIATALVAAGANTALEGTGAPGFAGKHAGELARDAGYEELANTIALDLIARAFGDRLPVAAITDSNQLSDVEFAEVMSFEELRWPEVSFELIEANADAVFWFAPEAFCYFLPGFLSAGIRARRWDSNSYDSLIGMLDCSPDPDLWDEFFAPRWTLLTRPELRAVRAWIDWFESVLPDGFHDNSYDRSRDTLRLLAERCG